MRRDEFSFNDEEAVKGDTDQVQSEHIICRGAEGRGGEWQGIHGVPVKFKCNGRAIQCDASGSEVKPEDMEIELLLDFIKADGKDRGVIFIFIGEDMEEIREWGDGRRWEEGEGAG